MKCSIDYQKDIEYARSRLCGTYVRFKSRACKVMELFWDDDMEISATILICPISEYDKTAFATDVKLSQLDLTPISMINIKSTDNRHAAWWMRKPVRYWKQGFCGDNLRTVSSEVKVMGYVPNAMFRFESPNFGKAVLGMYDSPHQAMELLLNEEVCSIPLSRSFSAVFDNTDKPLVIHGYRAVGRLTYNHTINEVGIKLDDEYDYLEQLLAKEVKQA